LDSRRRVIVVTQPPIETRDFCEGAAILLYRELIGRGAVEVADTERALTLIEQWEQGNE